jgi:ABC-2 type transport system ATP-binding protein
VGEIALAAGVAIYGIAEQRTDLERRFFELTNGQYQPSNGYGASSGLKHAPPAGLPPPADPGAQPAAADAPAKPPAVESGSPDRPSKQSRPEGGAR